LKTEEEDARCYTLQPKNRSKNFQYSEKFEVKNLPTEKEVIRKRRSMPNYCKLCLMPMFAAMSKITNNLYLTSVGGMTRENFERYKIGCVINATYEAPNLRQKGIEAIRVPVDDSDKDELQEFFDIVADKINEKAQENINVVVHCVAGISRSTTLVCAYLMKYHKMDLRTAFNHIHSKRPVVRPNNGFFKQLINYELSLFGKNSCKMINLNINDVNIEIPDFFQIDHKGFILLETLKEKNRQLKLKIEMKTKKTEFPEVSIANIGISSTSQISDKLSLTPFQVDSQNSSFAQQAASKSAAVIEEPNLEKPITSESIDTGLTAEEKKKEDLLKKFVLYKSDIESINDQDKILNDKKDKRKDNK
jgi:atypical dual specificity phosphatase